MKQALLIASFGTTVPRAEQEAAALERALAAAAPGWTAVRAYTSGMVRRVLARQGRPVDSPAEALAKLQAGGAGEVFVQPTHFLRGIEYDKLKAEALAAAGGFARLRVGRPLLDDTQVVREMATLLAGLYKSAAFTLQARYFSRTGWYVSRHRALLERLTGEDRAVLDRALALRAGEPVDMEGDAARLLRWAGALLRAAGEGEDPGKNPSAGG